MGLFNRKSKDGALMDVIRCDEPSYIIWKWHPDGTELGKSARENAIRWGSSLRVREGSVAVFVYPQRDGTQLDYIEGPYDGILETDNLPVLANIMGLAYKGNSPFQAEVYFINLAQIIQIKFGVPYFDVFDPRFLDYGVPTAVRGAINFRITDYREFTKLHRLDTFTMDDFQSQVKDAVVRYVKSAVSNAPEDYGIPLVQIERRIDQINDLVEPRIKERLSEEFGVTVSSLDISAIDVDKSSEGYRQLMSVTGDLAADKVRANSEVEIRELRDSQRLGVFERAGRTLTDITEGAYERHKQTQSANLAAYQLEAQEHVGVAGAYGMGMMGSRGTGGGGLNTASMMAGMTVGGAVGQNVAASMNSVMSGSAQQAQISQQVAPPPIPADAYYIAVGGQPEGPFDISQLENMVRNGELAIESLVWREGMEDWKRIGEVDELKGMFGNPSPMSRLSGMPSIPPS